jgi:hypothetical protein
MDARGSPSMQPTDELSKLPRYDSCHAESTTSVQGRQQENQGSVKQQTTPHAYREDTYMKALSCAFLVGGSVPSGLDEVCPVVTAVAPPVADEHDGTYEILNR